MKSKYPSEMGNNIEMGLPRPNTERGGTYRVEISDSSGEIMIYLLPVGQSVNYPLGPMTQAEFDLFRKKLIEWGYTEAAP
jgi:hypothetical protein